MIGKNQIVIDSNNFLAGMSTSVDTQDGGYSPETVNFNFFEQPGVLNLQTDAVDGDSDNVLGGEIIASCPDSSLASTDKRIVVTDDAKYYSYNGTKLSAELDEDDTAGVVYSDGVTDMIPFNTKIYTTNNDNITELTRPNTLNKTYHTFTNSAYLHPAIVFENNAFYGDANLLLRQTPTATPATILTLTTGHIITALGIDQGTGKMLIATSSLQNVSNTLPSVNKVMWYDGFSNKVIKSIVVEDTVTAFHNVGGVTYVGYGVNIGYLTGSGIVFLRKLENVTLDNTKLPYKQHFANIGQTLCVVDGLNIVAFGEAQRGKKMFHHIWKNAINTNTPRAIFDAGSNKLGVSIDTTAFYTFDITDLSPTVSGGGIFYSNVYQFNRPVHIRTIKAFLKTAYPTTAESFCVFQIVDDTGTTTNLGTISGVTTSTQKFVESVSTSIKTSSVQLKFTMSPTTRTNVYGVKRFIINYDVAE